jgi:hypothetical protein
VIVPPVIPVPQVTEVTPPPDAAPREFANYLKADIDTSAAGVS